MPTPIPIIVCGGNSERMGTDKYLLNYHGTPQFLHLANMLKPHFNEVWFSIQEKQKPAFDKYRNVIVDLKPYSEKGPISGLLSCLETIKGRSILFIGCDYPLLQIEDILKLSHDNSETSAYFRKYYEPLLARYNPDIFESLKKEFTYGNFSLMKFLEKLNAKKILAEDQERIISIDTHEEYLNTLNKIKQEGLR
jgi:molybdenum cofactor guanylyltransferase